MAKTIDAEKLIALFQRMYKEHWTYTAGAAEEGNVDCSGAFTYAFSVLGGGIEHGSNTIYRKRIGAVSTTPVPGYAAFKIKDWDASQSSNHWYNKTPGNVYHIGLVDSDGEHILNAKGTRYGFCRDENTSWSCYAPLLAVQYNVKTEETEEPMETLYQAVVVTESGALSLRTSASQGSQRITKIPKGDTVDVLSEAGDWYKVRYGQLEGYCAAKFLQRIGDEETESPAEATTSFICDETGASFTLLGAWRLAED